jgi:hypothetical protein
MSMPLRISGLVAAGLLIWNATALTQPQRPGSPGSVVLVTLDGVRWQEVFGGMDESLLRATTPRDTNITMLPVYQQFAAATARERREKLMPFLWRTFVVNHGFIAGDRAAGSLVSVTNTHWFSYPGYSEILTGEAHDDVIKSNDPIRNPFPSVLQFAQKRLTLTRAQVATFASWGVFNQIVESEDGATTVNAGAEAYDTPSPEMKMLSPTQFEARTAWANTRHDAFTFHFAMDYLKRMHPRLLYLSFDETDDWAHDGHYDMVLETLHRTDSYLKTLWETLQADPQYRGTTTLIILTDHGRGRTAEDWRSHGKNTPGSGEIWLAMASPDSPRRGEWRGHPALFQNQVAATMAASLGLNYREHNPKAGAPIPLGR